MSQRSNLLADYIQRIPGFEIVTCIDGNYGHMGATLTDAVLQRGVRYRTVVRPRVERLLAEYPNARTTSAFADLLDSVGGAQLLSWKGKQKLATLTEITEFLRCEKVETEDDFREWIAAPGNMTRLKKINGIKNKTCSYIEILLGMQSVAVDRHLLRFLTEAGLGTFDEEEARRLIKEAAVFMGVQPSILDHSIWRYMSERPC